MAVQVNLEDYAKPWRPGIYPKSTTVIYNNQLWILNDTITGLFTSSDFLAEVANGDWIGRYTTEEELDVFLLKDISAYPDATLPLIGTEHLLINDGTGFKKVEKNNISSGINFPSNNYIYGVKNNLAKRIDQHLSDSLMFAHTCQTGTTLYGTIVTAGNSAFSLGTHTNYGSLLNAVAASKVTSAATLGSVACYRNSFSHINSTATAKFKTETFITITNAVAPISSRLSTGFVNYSWSGGSNANPSVHALLSFCNDDGENYLKFCHRKLDGTVGTVSMGTLFPARFSNQAHVYQCCFYFLGNHYGFATIKDLINGNYFESNIVEVYKSFESNGLTFTNHINNNTTAEAVGFAQSGHVTKYIYGI